MYCIYMFYGMFIEYTYRLIAHGTASLKHIVLQVHIQNTTNSILDWYKRLTNLLYFIKIDMICIFDRIRRVLYANRIRGAHLKHFPQFNRKRLKCMCVQHSDIDFFFIIHLECIKYKYYNADGF